MPPRPRKPAPEVVPEADALPADDTTDPEPDAPQPKRTKPQEQPCVECFPQGWPADDATSAGCGHGSWQR